MHGEIEVKLQEEFLRQQRSSQYDANSSSKRHLIVTWLTFFAVLIYAALTAWLGFLTKDLVNTSQKTYKAASRPYVGVDGIPVTFRSVDDKGKNYLSTIPTPKTDMIMFQPVVKNFGTVPSTNTLMNVEIFENDVELPFTKYPDNPTTLFPGETVVIPQRIGRNDYSGRWVFT